LDLIKHGIILENGYIVNRLSVYSQVMPTPDKGYASLRARGSNPYSVNQASQVLLYLLHAPWPLEVFRRQ